jgi:hypothetical protein
MADGILTQTVNLANNAWGSVTTAFKTAGQTKTITATFFDEVNGTGTQVDSNSIKLNVGAATVHTVTIDVKDGVTSIDENGKTTNTKLTIGGTVKPALGKYYNVKVYDGESQLPGTVTYDNARTSWTFKPDRPLSGGLYKLTPKVATFDGGATGSASGTRTFTILLPLNDTGITSSQCYGAGSNDLISCTITTAINLYSKQDGMLGRDVSSPNDSDGKLGFSYSEVGNYPRTYCVKDNITGLMWEGKPASGLRGNPELDPNGTYTNYTGNQINTNAQGYVNAVNAAGLCGYTDWRLPTVSELQSIVDYGVASPGPTIDGNWFPNTKAFYWTSSPYVGNSVSAWGVNFYSGGVHNGNRSSSYGYVRLVR